MNDQFFKKYYKKKKVFLTGHTGFKGSWILYWLHQVGAIVKGYSLAPEREADLYHAIKGDELCSSIISDIRQKEILKKAILDFQPDFIFHMAAQPIVRRSYASPLETFDVNAMGVAYLLDSLRDLEKACAVVLVTTDKVYKTEGIDRAFKETDPLGGNDPYSASKACGELIIDSYRSSFFNDANFSQHLKAISSARAGNVIGGGDWSEDRLIPDIIKAMSSNATIELRNPHAIRPWQHVLEAIGAYLYLGARMVEDPISYSGAWNFGPRLNDHLTVEEVTKIIIGHWGEGDYIVKKNPNDVYENPKLLLDIDKSINILGWEPKLSARQAIIKTVDWYRKLHDDTSVALARELINSQIGEYTKK